MDGNSFAKACRGLLYRAVPRRDTSRSGSTRPVRHASRAALRRNRATAAARRQPF